MSDIDFKTTATQKLFRNILDNIPEKLRDDYIALDCEMVGTEKHIIYSNYNLKIIKVLLC